MHKDNKSSPHNHEGFEEALVEGVRIWPLSKPF